MDEITFVVGDRVALKTKFNFSLRHSVLPEDLDGLTGEITEARPAAPAYGHHWLMYTVKLDPNEVTSLETVPCKAHEMVKLPPR
jgi:hypothetical protein